MLLLEGSGFKSRLVHRGVLNLRAILGPFWEDNLVKSSPSPGLELTTLGVPLSVLTHWAICSERIYLHWGFSLLLFDARRQILKFERGSNPHHEKLQEYQYQICYLEDLSLLLSVQLQSIESHILSTSDLMLTPLQSGEQSDLKCWGCETLGKFRDQSQASVCGDVLSFKAFLRGQLSKIPVSSWDWTHNLRTSGQSSYALSYLSWNHTHSLGLFTFSFW